MRSIRKVIEFLLHHGCISWVSHERREYSVSAAMTAASARKEDCYGHCASQARGCAVFVYAMAVVLRE